MKKHFILIALLSLASLAQAQTYVGAVTSATNLVVQSKGAPCTIEIVNDTGDSVQLVLNVNAFEKPLNLTLTRSGRYLADKIIPIYKYGYRTPWKPVPGTNLVQEDYHLFAFSDDKTQAKYFYQRTQHDGDFGKNQSRMECDLDLTQAQPAR